MALLTVQPVKILGTTITYTPAEAAGDTLPPGAGVALHVRNGHTGPQSVTVAVPGNTRFGQPEPDVTVAVPAGGEVALGPFPYELADPDDSLVHVTYTGVTALTVAVTSI